MSGYTKGPWILDGVEIRALDSHPIDRICDMAPGFSEDDAKLIASSPDLLEALQACLDHGSMTGAEWVVEKAWAAINKATTIQ